MNTEKFVVDIDFNGMGKYILKALDRHNGQTIGTPLYLLIFLYSTKGHYIHFIVVIIISSFIYESLLCRQASQSGCVAMPHSPCQKASQSGIAMATSKSLVFRLGSSS